VVVHSGLFGLFLHDGNPEGGSSRVVVNGRVSVGMVGKEKEAAGGGGLV
jgi:hypothetical protein